MSPEDYTPLWKWISFAWIYPLIKKARYMVGSCTYPYLVLQGTSTTLADKDVSQLSPNLQSRPVFLKFSSLKWVSRMRVFSYIANTVQGCRPCCASSGLRILSILCVYPCCCPFLFFFPQEIFTNTVTPSLLFIHSYSSSFLLLKNIR